MIAEVVRRSVTGLAVLFSGLFYVAASRVNSPRLSVVLIRRRAFRCQGDGIISGGLIWCDRDKRRSHKKATRSRAARRNGSAARVGFADGLGPSVRVSSNLGGYAHASEMTETNRHSPRQE